MAAPVMPVLPALLALHYQNDVVHPQGRIRVGLGEGDSARVALTEAAGRLLAGARQKGWTIVHVRIAFRPDYADCPRNTPIFRKTIELGAARDGDWGSEFFEALAPVPGPDEFVFTHNRISAFVGTAIEPLLRLRGVQQLVVAGVATHSVVENTVRDAADRGFDVRVAADACAAAAPGAHEAALRAMALVAAIGDVSEALL